MTELQGGRSVPAGKTWQSGERRRDGKPIYLVHLRESQAPRDLKSVADGPVQFRFGSKMDIERRPSYVRSASNSEHFQIQHYANLSVGGLGARAMSVIPAAADKGPFQSARVGYYRKSRVFTLMLSMCRSGM
jgi:hypothetical protein